MSLRTAIALVVSLFSLPSTLYAMSLEQAVAYAIDTNPDVMRQYARFEAAVRESKAASGDYFPQVNLRAGIGHEDIEYKSGNRIDYDTDNRQEGAITISQLLFNGMKTYAENERLSQEAEAERLLLLSVSEDIALKVCEVYSALEQANQHIFLAERNLQEHQKIYDEIKGKVEKGVSSKADLAQITSRFSSSQSALLIARRELFDLQAQFFSVVGREPGQLVAPVIDRKLLPATLDDALVLARSNHPQIQSAQADVNAVQQELRAANSGYYPTISLDAEVYHNDNYGGFDGHDNGSRVMLNMRYNLFNGFKTTNKAKASGWRYREAHAIKDQAIIRNVENAKMAWNAAQYLKQQEEVLKVNVDAAVATDDGYRKQFNIGRRTLLDVLDAKIEVYLARRNYLNTRYDRLLSEYRLANAMGILMYALRIDYPEQWKEGE